MKIRVEKNSSVILIGIPEYGLVLVFVQGKLVLAQQVYSCQNYNTRHYDPVVGRFVTADTVIDGEGDTQGWNRYSYVKGNPVGYKDPSGHFSEALKIFDSITSGMTSGGGTEASQDNSTKEQVADSLHYVKSSYNQKTGVATVKLNLQFEKGRGVTDKEFSDYKKLAIKGIKDKWSGKNVDLGNGITASKVNVEINDKINSFKPIEMGPATDFKKVEIGKYKNYEGFNPSPTSTAEIGISSNKEQFKDTAAHEIGHDVLNAKKGIDYSWSHKGTSTLTQEKNIEITPTAPKTGDLDLMKYYYRGDPARTQATNEDIKALFQSGQ